MRKLTLLLFCSLAINYIQAQKPCSAPEYRQFDFWIGEWDVYNLKGQKAGDSKISQLLDSCIILEEWTSASVQKGLRYAGKSYNSYDAQHKRWTQYWVDNVGSSTYYNHGHLEDNKMVFMTDDIRVNDTTTIMQRLTFYNLGKDKVRQHGESSNDGGKTWKTSYDLEYRRKS
jgi:hypothetical protein